MHRERRDVAYQFWNLSAGEESAQGGWAHGPTPDGQGQFLYLANPQPMGPLAEAPPPDPRTFGTNRPGVMQRMVNKLTH